MSMLIVSQDGKIAYDTAFIAAFGTWDKKLLATSSPEGADDDKAVVLGEYSTKKQVEEAFELLIGAFAANLRVFRVPADEGGKKQ